MFEYACFLGQRVFGLSCGVSEKGTIGGVVVFDIDDFSGSEYAFCIRA